jgi:hypothetical protein
MRLKHRKIAFEKNNEDVIYDNYGGYLDDPVNVNFRDNENKEVGFFIEDENGNVVGIENKEDESNLPSLDFSEHSKELDQYGQAIESCEKIIKKIETEHSNYFDRIDLEEIEEQDIMILIGNYNTIKNFHQLVINYIKGEIQECNRLQGKIEKMETQIMIKRLSKQLEEKKSFVSSIQSAIGRGGMLIDDIEQKISANYQRELEDKL